MLMDEDAWLAHYGILRRSGRYPWGSGGEGPATSKDFLGMVESLRKQGLNDTEIAKGFGISTTDFRNARTIANASQKQAFVSQAQKLKDKGYSNIAIGKRMNINESSVRALLAPGVKDKADVLEATSNMLKSEVEKKGYLDVGVGVERLVGVSDSKLKAAISNLQGQGYGVHYVKVEQIGTGQQTTIKVLAKPGVTYGEVFRNRDKIRTISEVSEDGGRSFTGMQAPLNVSSKRIAIKYGNEGGAQADGVLYVRPGVKDLSLGGDQYAQVRVSVDGTHYIKGMAMYKDDLPAGVDIMFNTNKDSTGNKLDALKPLKKDEAGNLDPDAPFGAIVRQIKDSKGKVSSAMNIVNDVGDWEKWSKSLSSQMLSKQSPALAKSQLEMMQERKRNELDSIMQLNNPAVKKKLLEGFADDADSSAVHLKAAALPGQKTHVILPINSMKETEVYAPNQNNGDRVVLIRFPHGGKFEIPELTVNNKNPEAKKLLGNAPNAIGINHKVAQRLSGADFDGDTVLVIPNNQGKIKTQPALKELSNFDPIRAYPEYPGMVRIKPRTKQVEMGKVSNLITDMTIQGANTSELARAVRHSMVVIDAEKHNLDYKRSEVENGIAQLKAKYQGGSRGGATTVVSQRKSTDRVPERKAGFRVDPVTGKKIFTETGATFTRNGKTVVKKTTVGKLAETDDAHTLSSGTPIEKIYADHSNTMKALANEARKAAVNTKSVVYSSSAKTAHSKQVASLNAKLNVALKNAPLERVSQVIANAIVRQKQLENPDMDSATLKKVKGLALVTARARTQASKTRIVITDDEWAAIQAGAITNNKLKDILNNTDLDQIKELATPREKILMTSTKTQRAQSMLNAGYTQAEVAQALGVSLTTLKNSLSG